MSYSVVLVNSWRVVNAKGGTEKVFCELANALNKRGFRVTMLFCDPNQGEPGFVVDDEVRILNVGMGREGWASKVVSKIRAFSFDSETRKKKRSWLKIEKFSGCLKKAKKLLEESDVVLSFQPETTFILKKRLLIKTPMISMFHHNPSKYFSDPLFNPFFWEALSECEILQVLRPEFIKELVDVGLEKAVCIPNSCAILKQQRNLSARKIVYTGRVNLKQKRVDLLIKSFALLKDDFPDWCVEVWGELNLNSHDTKYVRALIERLGLGGRIFLKGATNDVESVLLSSSIFAFPSAYEGFGLSLIEAMMVGLPCVGCVDCPAVNTLIRNECNGILVEPNPKSFAKGLSILMENEACRNLYGGEARRTAMFYEPETVWNSWELLLKNIVSKSEIEKIK